MNGTPTPLAFFATAAKGTEGALRDELRELRLYHVRADRGGVHFEGRWEDAWHACLHSRIALRILAELARFDAPDGEALIADPQRTHWKDFKSALDGHGLLLADCITQTANKGKSSIEVAVIRKAG